MRNTKTIQMISIILVTLALLVSCGGGSTTATSTPATGTSAAPTGTTTGPDMVATASVVDTNEAFEKAISSSGSWIIATLKDLTFTKDLVLDGDFKNGRKDTAGNDIFQRKIGLYTQDANRNVTGRFTLTAPKLTVNSLNGSIEYGTFKGDLYIAGMNFKLIDATVEGNIYYKTQAIKDSASIDATSKVTGTQEVRAF